MAQCAECPICFETVDDGAPVASCGNPECTNAVCVACFKCIVSQAAADAKDVPRCSAIGCQEAYLVDEATRLLRNSDAALLQSYVATYATLQTLPNAAVQSERDRVRILEAIRRERIRFLKDRFPRAVYTVATIAMSSELRRVEKRHHAQVRDMTMSPAPRCFDALRRAPARR